MKKGLSFPNRVWERWTDQEVEAIIALCPKVIQVLVFHQQPDAVWEAQKLQLLALHSAIGCEFEYRMCGVGPSESPEYAVDWLYHKLVGLPRGKVIPFNEPNLQSEGWVNSDWIAWAREFGRIWKARNLADKLITPAMSPSADGYFSGTDAMTQLVRDGLYDYLGLHEYLNQIFTPIQVPVSITECNGKAPSEVLDYLARLYPTAEEAVWFSSKWVGAEDPNYHWDLIGNEDLSNSFKNWKEEIMDQIELWLKDLWERQGVQVNPTSGFWQYAIKLAREKNMVIVPCISPDGNYENWSYPGYVLAYTIPPLWCEVNVWVIKEGFPPLA